MDIVLSIMLNTIPDNELPPPARGGKWYVRGDVVVAKRIRGVEKQGQSYVLPNGVGHHRNCLLFITGIPDSLFILYTEDPIALINSVISSIQENIVTSGLIDQKRNWNLWDGLGNNTKNTLLSDKYDTINFAQLKSALRNKRTLALLAETDFV